PEDASKELINEGDFVCVESPRGKVDIKAKITDEVKPGILSSTFHFPDTSNKAGSSGIVNRSFSPRKASNGTDHVRPAAL
ncbi:MAG: hypothetical protein HN936_16415, partial [Bacteroidetes bacterium]|nr:hypothetical protein [Bacteroidota bacterium]